ncbi:MAG: DUF554 domain-containing protein [Oscillospiraceae bacterium]|nr:DUF554 domain-containing protein [Oscillospiraceae bacterium]
MTGTLINCAAIVAGGAIGLVARRGLRSSVEEGINKALGAAVIVLAVGGIASNLLSVSDGAIHSSGELLLIVSMVLGTLAGELLDIDGGLRRFSAFVEAHCGADGFAKGFSSATILFCVGAMAVVGSINDGLRSDSSILLMKSALDFTAAIVLAATLGAGVLFSAFSVLLYQGAITLLSSLLEDFLVGALLTQFCLVGYTIILCIGINFIAVNKIKTANMLPAMLIPVFWSLLRGLCGL